MTTTKGLVVFGAVDGLVACLGIVLATAMASATPHTVWHAALGLFVAEGLGMSAAEPTGVTASMQTERLGVSLGGQTVTAAISTPFARMGVIGTSTAERATAGYPLIRCTAVGSVSAHLRT